MSSVDTETELLHGQPVFKFPLQDFYYNFWYYACFVISWWCCKEFCATFGEGKIIISKKSEFKSKHDFVYQKRWPLPNLSVQNALHKQKKSLKFISVWLFSGFCGYYAASGSANFANVVGCLLFSHTLLRQVSVFYL